MTGLGESVDGRPPKAINRLPPKGQSDARRQGRRPPTDRERRRSTPGLAPSCSLQGRPARGADRLHHHVEELHCCLEIGVKKALYFNSETPNSLWIASERGNRERSRPVAARPTRRSSRATQAGTTRLPDPSSSSIARSTPMSERRAFAQALTRPRGRSQEVRVCERRKATRSRRWVTVGGEGYERAAATSSSSRSGAAACCC